LEGFAMPPRFYVATYGPLGLDVSFYSSLIEYNEAVNKAAADHEADRVDSYVHDELPQEG
jgi:hypothetical protein